MYHLSDGARPGWVRGLQVVSTSARVSSAWNTKVLDTSAACSLHRAGLEAPIAGHGFPTRLWTANLRKIQGYKERSQTQVESAQEALALTTVPGLTQETQRFSLSTHAVSRPPGGPIAGPGKSPPDPPLFLSRPRAMVIGF